MKIINVAIDGPCGAGKSSIARAAALELGFIHVDTGAMYRAVGLYALENKLDDASLAVAAGELDISLRFAGGSQRVLLQGRDVTDFLRSPEVSMAASRVSAIPAVREALLGLQKKIASENNSIMDGRDIGTVVLPHADLKIFLTASAEERASRRYLELQDKPGGPSYESILEDIQKRDDSDIHRAIAPLRQAEDAVLVDTSNKGFQEVEALVVSLIRKVMD